MFKRFFDRQEREERRIRDAIVKTAIATAEQQYKTDRQIRSLRDHDLTTELLQKLVDSCYYNLEVTITLHTGTKVTFTRKDHEGRGLSHITDRFMDDLARGT